MNRSRPKGVGNAGCPMHPQPRVQCRKHTSVVTTGPPDQPGAPARNGFNGFLRALPGDRLVVTVAGGLTFCPRPVGPTNLRQLDASAGASGPHDFAVRSNISRLCAWRSLTGLRPPSDPIAPNAAASTASHPASVTIAILTCLGQDSASYRSDLGSEKQKYFCKWGWTGQTHEPSLICPSGKKISAFVARRASIYDHHSLAAAR
ncbi:MAG: hypothetical protein JWP51_4451 [Bradyrhizobium sp.]|nr:hypothetical protein [Bradyrhizobium sp.]